MSAFVSVAAEHAGAECVATCSAGALLQVLLLLFFVPPLSQLIWSKTFFENKAKRHVCQYLVGNQLVTDS